jgi:hypothetical protein
MRMSRPVPQGCLDRAQLCDALEVTQQARGSKLCIQTRPNPACGWIMDGGVQLARSRHGSDMQCQAIGLPYREPCTTQRTPPLSRLSSSRREIYSTPKTPPTVCTHQQHLPP